MRKTPFVLVLVPVVAGSSRGEILRFENPIGPNLALKTGSRFVSTVELPAPPQEWGDAPAILLLEVEIAGGVGAGRATGAIALRRSDGGVLAQIDVETDHEIAKDSRACWTFSASSANLGPSEPAGIERAFDEDPTTFWHSRWEQIAQQQLPQRVEIGFAAPVEIVGVRYLPRQSGSSNGTIAKYRLEAVDASDAIHAIEGEWPAESPRAPREARFAAPLAARSLTLVARSEIHGQPFASAAEIEPIFATDGSRATGAEEASRHPPRPRAYLRVPVAKLDGARGVTIELRGTSTNAIVYSAPRLMRLPEVPTRAMLGKANGVDGPDRVDLGPLGIDAYTIHDHAPLPLMLVREGSPAARAKLVPGDIVVGIGGAPLPRSSCAVGDAWFERGHEPVIGRAIEAAQAKSGSERGRLELDVVRLDGRRESIRLELAAPALSESFPFDDGATAALERDLIAYVVRTQKPDGSWSTDGNDFIQTTLSALALLGARDPAHGERVLRAVRWMMNRFSEPERFGNLGYWSAGYATILAAEWHLATGDRSVLPFLEHTFEWAVTTAHTSAWETPTLGHGPDGLPYEHKALVAPATHLLVGEALARRCGVEGRLWDTLLPFLEQAWSDPKEGGHGALGYNASFRDLEEFWSRSGLFALAATLRGERLDMAAAMVAAMRKHHFVMRGSHAYGAPGNLLGLVGLSVADPSAFAEVMRAWRFSFTAAWEPGFGLRYSTPHMGSPYMGEEGLINPGFAVVFSARRKGLHVTGATDRGWLPIDSIATRLEGAALQLRRGRDGRVRIVAPGCDDVRIELDGVAPTTSSPRYLGPFPVREFAAITACVFDDDGAVLATTRRIFSRSKAAFSVLSASGWRDEAEARRRAEALFDEDGGRAWLPDRGAGAAGFPHRVVFDLGEARRIHGIVIDPGDAPPRRVEVRVGDDPQSVVLAAGAELGRDGRQIVRFDAPLSCRVVEVVFTAGFEDRLSVAEIDVLVPLAVPRRDARGRVVLESDVPGVEIRYTVDGSIPTANSPRYDGPFAFDSGLVLARCEPEDPASAIGGAWLEPAADSK